MLGSEGLRKDYGSIIPAKYRPTRETFLWLEKNAILAKSEAFRELSHVPEYVISHKEKSAHGFTMLEMSRIYEYAVLAAKYPSCPF